MLLPLVRRVTNLRRQRVCHTRLGDAVVTVAARYFLDDIGQANNPLADIQAMRWRSGINTVVFDRTLEFKPREQFGDFFGLEIDADPALDVLRPDRNDRIDWFQWILIHKPRRDL